MKKAIIIGASSGLGRGLARILADNNYQIGITGRRTALLDELRTERPNAYLTATLDVTDTNALVDKLNSLATQLGGLDLLVLSSGTGDINEELDFDVEKRTIDTNVSGFSCIADWAFNYFKRQQSGHLVAITSVGGLRGSRFAPAYSASKAYQINYLEGLRQKAARLPYPVYITDIRPGFVDTDMAKGDGLFWVASVDKAVRQIYDAIIQRHKCSYITKRWRLIGIIMKSLPRSIFDKL